MPRTSPLINGKNYSSSNVTAVIYGVPVVGCNEINYSRDTSRPNNYGLGREPISYGEKQFTYTGDITLAFDEVQAIIATSPNKSILEIPPSTVLVVFEGDGVLPTTHKLLNVRFTKDPFNVKSNDSIIWCKIPFEYAGLDKSGL